VCDVRFHEKREHGSKACATSVPSSTDGLHVRLQLAELVTAKRPRLTVVSIDAPTVVGVRWSVRRSAARSA
jgi:hypothetical protein